MSGERAQRVADLDRVAASAAGRRGGGRRGRSRRHRARLLQRRVALDRGRDHDRRAQHDLCVLGQAVEGRDGPRRQIAFTFKAAGQGRHGHVRGDHHRRRAGARGTALINVDVVNDPPVIKCTASLHSRTRRWTSRSPTASAIRTAIPSPRPDRPRRRNVERVAGVWRFIPRRKELPRAPSCWTLPTATRQSKQLITVTIVKRGRQHHARWAEARKAEIARGMALRFAGRASARGAAPLYQWTFGDGSPSGRGTEVAHRFRREGSFTVKARRAGRRLDQGARTPPAVELIGAPDIADGVMTLRVRTRVRASFAARGQPLADDLRAGRAPRCRRCASRSRPARSSRLTLRLRPTKSTALPGLSVRRLVLVAPQAAG